MHLNDQIQSWKKGSEFFKETKNLCQNYALYILTSRMFYNSIPSAIVTKM